jgi:hypothetical protein
MTMNGEFISATVEAGVNTHEVARKDARRMLRLFLASIA